MVILKVLFIVTVSLPWSLCKLDKYCAICTDHTMCKYHGIGPDCDDIGGFGVTPQERQEILDVHNWYRRFIASGSEKRGIGGPQPKAANMNKLVWDEDLAIVAQRWADQCRFQHDTCRNDRKYCFSSECIKINFFWACLRPARWRVGQNIYWKWKYPVHRVNWTDAILAWYNEVTLFNTSEVESYRFNEATGHYTQLLWHDTTLVGCGRRDYGPNKIYVCNYGPAGNWINEPMYTIGEPCSKCSKGMSCSDYLCAKPEVKPVVHNVIQNSPELTEPPTTYYAEPPTEHSLVEVKEVDNLNPSNRNKGPNIDYEVEKTTISKPVDHAKPGTKHGAVHHPTSNPQLTSNSIETPYPLDAETRSGIEEIKLKIERLVQKVIRKVVEKH